ncbi:hypothetical protein FRC03_001889 [Tulasnella sp. 419]|nr:hypothetical protein FRC02_000959 [Tulasnella sp. 418]KAG8964327.1 hypothetical protein FRC03_001889 [Tulasnella sp. 419]
MATTQSLSLSPKMIAVKLRINLWYIDSDMPLSLASTVSRLFTVMRMILSSILVFLAILSSAMAGIVGSSLRKAGLEPCPNDQEIRIHNRHVKAIGHFELLEEYAEGHAGKNQDKDSILYQANLFAVGSNLCMFKLSDVTGRGKYDDEIVMTERGQNVISVDSWNPGVGYEPLRLLRHGSNGGQYKWTLVRLPSYGFGGFQRTDEWRAGNALRRHRQTPPPPELISECEDAMNEAYTLMAQLTPELQFRRKAMLPDGVYFGALLFLQAAETYITIDPEYITGNHPLGKQIVQWDAEEISKYSEYPLKDNEVSKRVCRVYNILEAVSLK